MILALKYCAGLFLMLGTLRAQDTLQIEHEPKRLPLNARGSYFITDQSISADSAYSFFTTTSTSVHKEMPTNFGSLNRKVWVLYNLKNEIDDDDFVIQVQSAHLQKLTGHLVKKGEIVSQWITGANFSFDQRPLPHRYFCFPFHLQKKESISFLLLVEQTNGLELPMFLWSKSALASNDYKLNLLWGVCFGFLGLASVFALMGLVIIREKLFLWYCLYVVSALLYGMVDQGFGFQFLYPFAVNFDPAFSIHAAIYTYIFLIKFSQSLLNTKSNLVTVHRYLNGIFWFFVIMIFQDLIFQERVRQFSMYYLPAVNFVLIGGLLMLIYAGAKLFPVNKKIAVLFLTAYGIIVVTAIAGTLTAAYGVGASMGVNPVVPGFVGEIIILSIAVVFYFRDMQEEKNLLQTQLITEQKKSYDQYIDGIERERSRIAGELHDDIGSRLSLIKNSISQIETIGQKSISDLSNIIHDLRNLSHQLSPAMAALSGLLPLVEKIVAEYRQTSGIDIRLQVFDLPQHLQPIQVQHIYRIIQEALQNIVKHSKASSADVQLFGHGKELVITIEDDGIGFNTEGTHEGIGIHQMKMRTQNMGGRFEINCKAGSGCQIIVEIPYSPFT